jgi:hypothetical protein
LAKILRSLLLYVGFGQGRDGNADEESDGADRETLIQTRRQGELETMKGQIREARRGRPIMLS